MSRSLHLVVTEWLNESGISLSANYVSDKLLSHSEFPSLSAITDMLDELGIENRACIVEKNEIDNIPLPFLAHLGNNANQFILITDVYTLKNENSDNFLTWDGVVVIAEPFSDFKNEENDVWVKKDRLEFIRKILFYAIGLFFSVIVFFSQSAAYLSVIVILNLVGIFLSLELTKYEMGVTDSISSQFCSIIKSSQCGVVREELHKPKLFGRVNFSEIVFVWFSSIFLLVVISALNNTLGQIEAVVSILTLLPLPVTFFSIYYQWKILKKWCSFCISIVTVVWIQSSIVIFSGKPLQLTSVSIGSVFQIFILVFIISFIWWVVKSGINTKLKLRDELYLLRRFKNDPIVLKSVLKKGIRSNFSSTPMDFQIGQAESPLQILVVCSPYCKPCSKAHFLLEQYVKGCKAGLTIRFMLKGGMLDNDLGAEAVKYLFEVLDGKDSIYKRKILHDWYSVMDIGRFKKMYPVKAAIKERYAILSLSDWSKSCTIRRTPTVFINGYEVIEPYSAFSLPPINAVRELLK